VLHLLGFRAETGAERFDLRLHGGAAVVERQFRRVTSARSRRLFPRSRASWLRRARTGQAPIPTE
jgi:hypothetical protein